MQLWEEMKGSERAFKGRHEKAVIKLALGERTWILEMCAKANKLMGTDSQIRVLQEKGRGNRSLGAKSGQVQRDRQMT